MTIYWSSGQQDWNDVFVIRLVPWESTAVGAPPKTPDTEIAPLLLLIVRKKLSINLLMFLNAIISN